MSFEHNLPVEQEKWNAHEELIVPDQTQHCMITFTYNKWHSSFLFPICLPNAWIWLVHEREVGVRGSNFGLVLVSVALWEISIVADPVISSAC